MVRVDPNLVYGEERAPWKANARRLHQIAKYSRASRIFYGLRIFRAASGISDDTTALTPGHEQTCQEAAIDHVGVGCDDIKDKTQCENESVLSRSEKARQRIPAGSTWKP